MNRGWSARRRRRLLLRVVVPALVVVVGVTVYLGVSARTVVPGLSGAVYPIHYAELIAKAAERYSVDPYLVAAIVQAESGYDHEAVSRVGAVGLMQLMPETAKWVTGLDRWRGPGEYDLVDPEDNLELGICYLAYLLDRFAGDYRAAVAAYNAGQGAVGGWLRSSGPEAGLELADIPFAETREFVKRVEHYHDLYVRVHPELFGLSMEAV